MSVEQQVSRLRTPTARISHRFDRDLRRIAKATGVRAKYDVAATLFDLRRSIVRDSSLSPDIAKFITERVKDNTALTQLFGWRNISLSEATLVIYALSPQRKISYRPFFREIKREATESYPDMRKLLKKKTNIPARFFLRRFRKAIPQSGERERLAKAIKNTRLTPIEFTQLILLSCGRSNGKIAQSLDVSRQTVKNHNSDLFKKLNRLIEQEGEEHIHDRVGATFEAIKRGLLPASILEQIPEYAAAEKITGLSPQEKEVLRRAGDGRKTNKQIGQTLNLKEQTVKNRFSSIFKKLGEPKRPIRRLQAILMSYFYDLKHPPEASASQIVQKGVIFPRIM